MTIAQMMIGELEHEAQTTRRFLERVPADRLDWSPHEKSLTAGQLALHIATVPSQVGGMAREDDCPMPDFAGGFPQPATIDEVLAAHDEGVAFARGLLDGLSDERMMATWRMLVGEEEMLAMPRVMFLRSILFNHWYHHRGQLGVYLRLLGASVPSAYGPSADEMPPEFARIMEAAGRG